MMIPTTTHSGPRDDASPLPMSHFLFGGEESTLSMSSKKDSYFPVWGEGSPLLVGKQGSDTQFSEWTAEETTSMSSSCSDHINHLEEQRMTPFDDEPFYAGNQYVAAVPFFGAGRTSQQYHDEEPILEEEEMLGLTRHLSFLPADIPEIVPMVPFEELEQHPPVHPPAWAYFLLFASVLAHAAVGPVLELEADTTPAMKVTWRMLGTFFVVLPLMIREIQVDGIPRLGSSEWSMIALSIICYDGMVLSFCFAVEYTAVGTAVILGNALAIVVLLGKLIGGLPVCSMELLGATVAMSGALLCTQEERGGILEDGTTAMPLAWFGDIMAIICSFCGVGYLLCAKWSRQQIPLGIFTGLIMLASTFIMWGFQVFVLGQVVTFDADREHGLFGCFRLEMDRLPLESTLVLFCNGFGTIGYVVVTQYLDTLTISSTALLQPVLSEFLAFGFGVGDLPGAQGWFGNVLVALGTLAVVMYSSGDHSHHHHHTHHTRHTHHQYNEKHVLKKQQMMEDEKESSLYYHHQYNDKDYEMEDDDSDILEF